MRVSGLNYLIFLILFLRVPFGYFAQCSVFILQNLKFNIHRLIRVLPESRFPVMILQILKFLEFRATEHNESLFGTNQICNFVAKGLNSSSDPFYNSNANFGYFAQFSSGDHP